MMENDLDFESIHTAFRPKIHRYLARFVGGYDAEDLTQEVFTKVSQSLKTFRGESQLSTWIYRIATNVAIDKIRTPSFKENALGKQLSGSSEFENTDAWTGETPPSAQQHVERLEMNRCIRDIVDQLPPNYRTVLILSELEDVTNSDIAEILGVTLGTVKIRLHRAKKLLKVKLQAHCKFYRDEQNEFACDLKSAFGELE